MEAVEGRKSLGNPLKPLNSIDFSYSKTLLETPPRVLGNLWTNRRWVAARRIVHSLCPGCTAAVHNIPFNHSLSLRISLCQSSRSLPSVSSSVRICRQACSTVVWSRPAKASPISGSECSVSSLVSAIAT